MDAAIEQACHLLKTGSPSDKLAALKAIAGRPQRAAAAQALLAACDGTGSETDQWAQSLLEELGPPAVADLAAIGGYLSAGQPDQAFWAATLLGRLKQQAVPALPGLTQVLSRRSEPAVQEKLVWALGQMGPAAQAAVPELQRLGASAKGRLARLCTEAISQIETGAAS